MEADKSQGSMLTGYYTRSSHHWEIIFCPTDMVPDRLLAFGYLLDLLEGSLSCNIFGRRSLILADNCGAHLSEQQTTFADSKASEFSQACRCLNEEYNSCSLSKIITLIISSS